MKQFDSFRNIEMEWDSSNVPKSCLFSSLNLYLPAEKDDGKYYSEETLNKAIDLIQGIPKINFKEKILPYSFYGAR